MLKEVYGKYNENLFDQPKHNECHADGNLISLNRNNDKKCIGQHKILTNKWLYV